MNKDYGVYYTDVFLNTYITEIILTMVIFMLPPLEWAKVIMCYLQEEKSEELLTHVVTASPHVAYSKSLFKVTL